jgi:predicted RNase H-like HicB family nuclease
MTLPELITRCKAGVYLTVNRYRDYYQNIEEAIAEAREQYDADNLEIDEDLAHRMVQTGQFWELQFYPRTPVGFNIVWGTSLEEVLQKAEEALK